LYPILLKIGDVGGFHLAVRSYGLMLAIAYILGILLAAYLASKRGYPANKFIDLGFWIVVSSIVGARLFYILLNLKAYFAHPVRIFQIWEGGLTFYGGFLLALVVSIWFMKRNKIRIWQGCDIVSISVALGYGITRIGCFLNGCCYGKPTGLPWGIVFPTPNFEGMEKAPWYLSKFDPTKPVAEFNAAGYYYPGVSIHPTQLYSSLAGFIIFGILLLVYRKKRFDGQVFWLFVFLYSIYRFLVEFLRADKQPILFNLTEMQYISIILFLVAILAYFDLARRARKV
jgi:phosphatidylglycerol:prolipoprotein diacylglycerol transferase